MQAAHNVKFRDRLAPAFARRLPDLFERHRVRIRIALLLAERAQPATRHADIGRIDMAVDVEIRDIAMHAFAHDVGQVAQRQHVARAVEREPSSYERRSPASTFSRMATAGDLQK